MLIFLHLKYDIFDSGEFLPCTFFLRTQFHEMIFFVFNDSVTRAYFSTYKSPCTPKALSPGVERQILGVKINSRAIQLWHAHCKRLDAAFKIHNALV